jgi:UDP-2,3-diacylglucosamine pyrophosphatase LpxH
VATAIVSDIHLGTASARDLLRRRSVRAALIEALADMDELVLLGDLLELREQPVADVLAVAAPILRELGHAMAGRPVTIVPGNHDYQLAAPMVEQLRMQERALEVDSVGELPRDGPLAAVAHALEPAQVRIAYPGVWVREDVYATHGHYLDVHNTVPSFERLAIGAVLRVTGALPPGPLEPYHYEGAVSPVYALTYALAQSSRGGRLVGADASVRAWQLLGSGGGNGRRARVTSLVLGGVVLPGAVAALNRAGLGPLKTDLSGQELRRAALAGMTEVVERLGIEADHVIFGHTHRSGPHERDAGVWDLPGGGRLMNTGSWIHEPAFLGASPRESPYFPGHLGFVPDTGPPELRTLLEEIPPADA